MRRIVALVFSIALAVAACGDDGGSAGGDGEGRPTVVVTTSILGDVVAEVVGGAAEIEVVMPRGSNPHDFQAPARQVAEIREADLLVTSGYGFEEGLTDAIEAAEADGVAVFVMGEAVPTRAPDGDHADEEAVVEDGEGDEHGHEGGDDPHWFTDPGRMAEAVEALVDELGDEVPSLDAAAVRERGAAYVAELHALTAEMAATLEAVPAERRVLVTNHEVFGHFADRFDFEVVGAVIPGGSTLASPSPAGLQELAETIDELEIPAIFAETTSPARLADALAAEVSGEVEVVELFSESLGEPDGEGGTYVSMMRTNAQRIAAALG